jgi:cold shock CspA family protein
MKGTILLFDPRKGFGFIGIENEDVFLHRSALPDEIKHRRLENTPCEFDFGEHNGKKVAVNVRLCADPETSGVSQ